MKFAKNTLFAVSFYVAGVSGDEFINFVNEDRKLICNGDGMKWFLTSKDTQILDDGLKFFIQTNANESTLLVKHVNLNDIGEYKCISGNGTEQNFYLKIYCKESTLKFRLRMF